MRIASALTGIGAVSTIVLLTSTAASQGIFPKSFTEDKALEVGLTLDYEKTSYQWQDGAPPTQMRPVNTHICLLTGLAGNFAGAGERIAIEVDAGANGGPKWILTGTAQQNLRANATCFPKSAFTPGMLSPSGIDQFSYPPAQHGACGAKLNSYNPTPATAMFIRSIAGKFRGGGEVVSVIDSPGRGIAIQACSGYVGGALQSVGMKGPQSIWYFASGGRTTSPTTASFSGVTNTQGVKYFPMATSRKAICGLFSVSGKFANGGDAIDMIELNQGNKPMWTMRLQTGPGGYVAASFRCLARDQR